MRALRFELKGETAFFKKPDVNVHTYFTYTHIHKVALFGILGAILGLGGYMQQYDDNYPLAANRKKAETLRLFPEFYEVFQLARVSIVPHGDRGYFAKKIQIFNNTVGYANQDGGTLNVREQWLEKPHWTIYVAGDEGLSQPIFDKLGESCKKAVFFAVCNHPFSKINSNGHLSINIGYIWQIDVLILLFFLSVLSLYLHLGILTPCRYRQWFFGKAYHVL